MKMQTFRKPHQWLNFWLEKYSDVLATLKYSGEKRKQYWAILKQFLEELPGNPRNIPIESVKAFIDSAPEERLHPISIFYQQIAPSKPHMELLKKIGRSVTSGNTAMEQDPQETFTELLAQKEFSPRTIKNYTSSLSAFIKWLGKEKASMAPEQIDAYCTYLSKEKKLAPRTIALHIAALKMYHKLVVDGETARSGT
ncbi:MAG: phage integrase N-terminal SAM-like domain-containing protein [Chitinispirillaceae bacterium]|nr:phage integrase N-terminal SAM-like domain-containing protein [Chitinispirillaceae bacterium]